MKARELEALIAESKRQRLEALGTRLLAEYDRSADSLEKFGWELEEELCEQLYVSLDMLGWNPTLLYLDFAETQQDLATLLEWFEEREEYECCALIGEAQRWLQQKCERFSREIDAGCDPADLIGN